MLSYNKVVARSYLEMMYQDTCAIVEYQKVTNPDGSKGFREVTIQDKIPCRLSFKSGQTTGNTESASPLTDDIELFLSPDIEVKAGSKIVVTHFSKETAYQKSGEPAIYEGHQQVHLELFKGWS